jgi:predicted enzyme related to lactoylglutathione lyase
LLSLRNETLNKREMKNRILAAGLVLAMGLSACNRQDQSGVPAQQNDPIAIGSDTTTKTENAMQNLISIVEIPATDFPRALTFYQAVLAVTIQEVEMDGVTMGILPNAEGTVNVVLAKGGDYKPTTDGAVVYLNAGKDLQPMLDRVKQNGGQLLVPKTMISPEMGYFALFIDTEGNKLGLHSMQ